MFDEDVGDNQVDGESMMVVMIRVIGPLAHNPPLVRNPLLARNPYFLRDRNEGRL